MPIMPVSLNGNPPSIRTVECRTPEVLPGALCEIWADEGVLLCVVERINTDGSITVRPLPAAPIAMVVVPKHH